MRARRRERGFTLMEVLLSVAVMAIAGIGIAALLVTAARAQATAVNGLDAMDAGTLASERIALELHELRAPPSIGLRGTLPAELHFLDYSGREIRYRVVSGRLVRSENGGPDRTIAEGVAGLQAVYRRRDGTPAAARHEVRSIEFGFTVVRGHVSRTFGRQIYPASLEGFLADWRER